MINAVKIAENMPETPLARIVEEEHDGSGQFGEEDLSLFNSGA